MGSSLPWKVVTIGIFPLGASEGHGSYDFLMLRKNSWGLFLFKTCCKTNTLTVWEKISIPVLIDLSKFLFLKSVVYSMVKTCFPIHAPSIRRVGSSISLLARSGVMWWLWCYHRWCYPTLTHEYLKGAKNKLDRTKVRILQGTNISHLGKRKIIFKSALVWDMLVSRRVFTGKKSALNHTWQADDQKSESLRFSMTKQSKGWEKTCVLRRPWTWTID